MEQPIPEPKLPTLTLDYNGIWHLQQTRWWTNFMSIAGFVFIGIMVLIAVVMMVGATAIGPARFVAIIPISVIIAIYYFPIVYLWRFSSQSKIAVEQGDPEALSDAMKYLKMHYRFMGILMMIVIGFYAIVISMTLLTVGLSGSLDEFKLH